MKTKFNFLSFLSIFFIFGQSYAQDLNQPGYSTFRDTRIINGHSVETSRAGNLKFIIQHRFGSVKDGAYNLWGLDDSTIRLGLDYGFSNRFTVGIGRSSFNKTYDGYLKYRILVQNQKSPISITYLGAMAIIGLKKEEFNFEVTFNDRLTYTHQLLIARKFGDKFSLQLMPSLVHRNTIMAEGNNQNDVFSIGSAIRYQLFKFLAITGEYYYTLPDQLQEGYNNSVSVGFEIETKGHVFQLHLSSSRGMIEPYFIAGTTGDFFNGDIHLGFNISRDFKLKGKKYH